MSQKLFLAEAIDYSSFKINQLNLITAPCGSGKTTAAFKSIPQYLGVDGKHSLILINSVSGAEEFVQDQLACHYEATNNQWNFNIEIQPQDKPTVMTYAMFGAQIKKGNLNPNSYSYIVCDQLHTLNTYIGMSRGKLRKQYPQAKPWQVNDMLQMTCFTYIALEQIYNILKQQQHWVFALTATPAQLYKNDLAKLSQIINQVQYSQKLHAYQIFCKFEYSEIEPILKAVIPQNRKRLFYFNTVKQLQQYKQVLLECGRAAEAIWSTTNTTHPMSQQNLTTRDYVLKQHKFPPNVQDLLINGAYETAISIKDPLVKQAYIHTGNADTRIQARNRLRQDLEIVGYYNSSNHKSKKQNDKRSEKNKQLIQPIPQKYLNVPLFTQDKQKLIEEIQFKAKWPSLKKALIEQGYIVQDKNNKQKRFSVIKKQQ